jgi:hypothetical protein
MVCSVRTCECPVGRKHNVQPPLGRDRAWSGAGKRIITYQARLPLSQHSSQRIALENTRRELGMDLSLARRALRVFRVCPIG